ncbi:hypothetical protein BJF79_13955 [Actinomadura sp. CNU-125]|nr:hypothetical protein BJF79_13955 [Actinomadura sp. CNU-125]
MRRQRLAAELRKIREDRGLTLDELAQRVFLSRTKMTRLENCQIRPDLHEILNVLDVLEVEGSKREKLINLTREAGQKGWWDRYGMSMGPRQKLYADLEAHAASIRSYNQAGFPVMLQTSEFMDELVRLDECQGPLDYQPDRMARAREQRQEVLLRSGGAAYETILDECVVHRLAVPPTVMARQLLHLVEVVSSHEQISLRLLPPSVALPGGLLPKASFFIYTFTEKSDPETAVVDTVNTDLVHTKRQEVERYKHMYDRLREASLSAQETVGFLMRVANRLADRSGSET